MKEKRVVMICAKLLPPRNKLTKEKVTKAKKNLVLSIITRVRERKTGGGATGILTFELSLLGVCQKDRGIGRLGGNMGILNKQTSDQYPGAFAMKLRNQ